MLERRRVLCVYETGRWWCTVYFFLWAVVKKLWKLILKNKLRFWSSRYHHLWGWMMELWRERGTVDQAVPFTDILFQRVGWKILLLSESSRFGQWDKWNNSIPLPPPSTHPISSGATWGLGGRVGKKEKQLCSWEHSCCSNWGTLRILTLNKARIN